MDDMHMNKGGQLIGHLYFWEYHNNSSKDCMLKPTPITFLHKDTFIVTMLEIHIAYVLYVFWRYRAYIYLKMIL